MPPRNRKPKEKAPFTPLRPSEIPLAAPSSTASRARQAPLVTLTADDLRAAGVRPRPGGEIAGRSAGEWAEALAMDDEDLGLGPGVKVQRLAPGEVVDETGLGLELELEGEEEAEDRAVEAWWDEFFDALMWTVPFSFLYLMLDILTNLSYSRHPPFARYLKNYLMSTPTIGIIMFYTTRHASSFWVRAGLTLASMGSGMRLIWLVNRAPYLDVIAQGPAMGTIWILTIVQLPLLLAVLALAAVGGWLKYARMKLIP